MPAKKSQFLSSFGKAFQIFKAITDAVLDQGGVDEDVARILTDGDLAKDIATCIMHSKEAAKASKSALDETVARLRQKKEEAEAPAKELKRKIDLAVADFLEFIHSNEGQKSLEFFKLSSRAVVVFEWYMHWRNETAYFQLSSRGFNRYDIFNGDSDRDSRVKRMDFDHQQANNTDHRDFTEEGMRFLMDIFVDRARNQPEEFLPLVKQKIAEAIAKHQAAGAVSK